MLILVSCLNIIETLSFVRLHHVFYVLSQFQIIDNTIKTDIF